MGGQACVFYGAAQVSKDIDFVLFANTENFRRLHNAMSELKAECITVPRFDPSALARGHAVHFRCQAPGVAGLRIDLMTRLRGLSDFETLWDRRTSFADDAGHEFNLLCIPDLVIAKKRSVARIGPSLNSWLPSIIAKTQILRAKIGFNSG